VVSLRNVLKNRKVCVWYVPEDNVSNSSHAASNDSTTHVLEKISKEIVADSQGTSPVFV